MRTNWNLPEWVLTTLTIDPKGSVGWAAVRASQSNLSPLAVFRPCSSWPYQLALPTQTLSGLGGSLCRATRGVSVAGTMGNRSGNHGRRAETNMVDRLIVCILCDSNPINGSTQAPLCQPLFAINSPCISLILNTLYSHRALSKPTTSRSLALGSVKLVVPTCTADAPTSMYSRTSSAFSTPPSPRMGMDVFWRTSQTRRRVSGLIAGPERPPVGLPSRDLRVRRSTAIAGYVLATVRASAPASSAAFAISPMS